MIKKDLKKIFKIFKNDFQKIIANENSITCFYSILK